MSDATGAAEALLGLPGFRVIEVHEDAAEVLIVIELVADLVGCPGWGSWPEPTAGRMSTTATLPPSAGRRGFAGESAATAARSGDARSPPGPSPRPRSRRAAFSPIGQGASVAARSA